MEPLQSPPRFANSFPDDSVVTNFACRLSGKVNTEDAAYCALVLRGKQGAEFTIRVWNTGRVDTGRFLETAAKFAVPKLGPAPEKAVRKGEEKNDLLVIVEGTSMRVFVNGEQVGDAVALPKGLEEPQVGFLTCQTGSGAARFVVSRFTLWKLK